ncbi:aspartic proteinase CDR1-like [Primulina eburnea]|uniref:aspartic proteinase CDR1-like n=1 Tax=Primulina eburnea TaxID=1245227 RepID=UPI003C6CA9F1
MKIIFFAILAAIAMCTTMIITNKKTKISECQPPMSFSKQHFDQFPNPQLIITRIFHHHSVHSPFYNAEHTLKDRADFDLIGSIARISSFIRYPKSRVSASTRKVGFFAYVRVGEIKLEQLLYLDTGSSLLWFNCQPCGLNVPEPIFDPKRSSTYTAEDCDLSDYCGGIGVRVWCDTRSRCSYGIKYGDGGYSAGHLAREMLVFGSTRNHLFGKREEVMEDVVVGCARQTSIYANGILGLGSGRVSLLKQRSFSKFSYCLGYYDDRSYPYNTLIIGHQAKQLRYGTPLIIQGKYYINLVRIRIGKTLLVTETSVLKRNPDTYSGGMVVDTGSSLSFLTQVEYRKFETGMINVVTSSLVRSYSIMVKNHTRLCYFGQMDRDLVKFPTVQFQFENDALLEVDERSLFQQVTVETFCLTFMPSESVTENDISILGNLMQQGYYIAYDLEKMMFSFQQMDCDEIDGYVHDEL